jgi:hypothetical protein
MLVTSDNVTLECPKCGGCGECDEGSVIGHREVMDGEGPQCDIFEPPIFVIVNGSIWSGFRPFGPTRFSVDLSSFGVDTRDTARHVMEAHDRGICG